jgi:glutamate-5-semialdehyde dehydrogenase
VIDQAAQDAGLPAGWLALLETRADVKAMLALDDYIDLVIPRGSNAFVRYIMDNTRIPVMGHADGICHVYVDGDADMQQAVEIAVDSKCQYPAVCNAMETLLVDEGVAAEFLPRAKRAFDEGGVELRGCDRTRVVIDCYQAGEKDWRTEYNDLILSVRVVDGLDAAIDHINTYGSGHTDAIVTRNAEHARRFLARVDSADVFWNCSTRFSDGYRFGLGAEVGISTSKLHARGPVGLEGLVIYKWLLLGQGHTVRQFVGADARVFDHVPLDKDFSL